MCIRDSTTLNSSLCFDMLTSVYRDKSNILWLSTEYGLSSYDNTTQKFKSFQNKEDDKNSISNNNVIKCFEDSRGFFWICTNNGLNLLDRGSNLFRHFTTAVSYTHLRAHET